MKKVQGNAQNLPLTQSNSHRHKNLANEQNAASNMVLSNYRIEHLGRYSVWTKNCTTRLNYPLPFTN
jgi:hypothetical protein